MADKLAKKKIPPVEQQQDQKPESLQKQLDEKQLKLDEYVTTLKRLQADFENYIKRADKERLTIQTTTTAKTLSKFLTTLDDFDRASTLIQNTAHAELKQGITMIHTNLKKLMQDEGIHAIPTVGQAFDPYKHEIIDIITSDTHTDGTIVDELQRGYMYHNIVLRPSKVRVAQHNKQTQEKPTHVQP